MRPAVGINNKTRKVYEQREKLKSRTNAQQKIEEANNIMKKTKDLVRGDRDKLLQKAIELYSIAITDLQNPSSNEKDYSDLFAKRGEAYLRLGNLRQAKLDLLNAIRQDGTKPGYYCLLAKCHEESEEFTEALNFYLEAINHSTMNSQELSNIYLQRGILLEKQGKFKEASKDFKHVINLKMDKTNVVEQALLERGRCLRKIGKYNKSLVCLREAYEKIKNLPQVQKIAVNLNELGLTYFQLGRFDDALDNYSKAIDLDPENGSYYNNKALAQMHLDQIELAMHDFNKAIELQPDDYRTFLNRGDAWTAMKNFDQAHKDYDHCFQMNPSQVHLVYHSKGLAYQLAGDFNEALRCFEKALEHKVDDLSSMFHLGLMQNKLKFLNAALETFSSVINIVEKDKDGDKRLAYEARGLVYLDMKNFDLAHKDFTKAIFYDEQCGEVFYYRGLARIELDMMSDAVYDFLNALEKNSKNPGIYKGLGMAYKNLEEFSKSLHYFNLALERAPENTDFLLQRSFLYIELKKYIEAIDDLTKALKCDDKDPLIWYKRGLALYMNGQYKDALDDLIQSSKRDPYPTYAPDVYYLMGLSLAHLERFSESIQPFTKAIELCKFEAIYYHERAKCYHLIGEYEKAIEDYTMVINIEPLNSYAYFGRGFATKNLGDYKKAADDLEKAKEIDPNNPKLMVNYKAIYKISYIRLCPPGEKH